MNLYLLIGLLCIVSSSFVVARRRRGGSSHSSSSRGSSSRGISSSSRWGSSGISSGLSLGSSGISSDLSGAISDIISESSEISLDSSSESRGMIPDFSSGSSDSLWSPKNFRGGPTSQTLGYASMTTVFTLFRPSGTSRYNRHRSTAPSEREEDYFYFDNSRLNASFSVNGNQEDTAFLFALNEDVVLYCLIVSNIIDEYSCPYYYRDFIISNPNATFLFPYEFNTSVNTTAGPINLCCGSSSLFSSIVLIFVCLKCALYFS